MAFVNKGKTAAVKKAPKVKCQGCVMVNKHFLSNCKIISKEAKKMIMSAKRQEWKAKKQVVVATEVEKE